MTTLLRLLGPAAAAGILAAPVGDLTLLLALSLALSVGLAAMVFADLNRRVRPKEDATQLFLRRRTLPQLRARRPTGVVEAQVLWRHAAEAHRRSRESA